MQLFDEKGDFVPPIQTACEIIVAAIAIFALPGFFHYYPGSFTGLESSFHWSWLKRKNRDLRDYVNQDFDILCEWLDARMTPREKMRAKYRFERMIMKAQTGSR